MDFREVELSEAPFKDCESVIRTSPFSSRRRKWSTTTDAVFGRNPLPF